MSDTTYCMNRDCPFEDCERHCKEIYKLPTDGTRYVSIADFSGTCHRYIEHLVETAEK